MDGRFEYRVWGTRRSSRRLDLVRYEDGFQARTIAVLSADGLVVDEDGRFTRTASQRFPASCILTVCSTQMATVPK